MEKLLDSVSLGLGAAADEAEDMPRTATWRKDRGDLSRALVAAAIVVAFVGARGLLKGVRLMDGKEQNEQNGMICEWRV